MSQLPGTTDDTPPEPVPTKRKARPGIYEPPIVGATPMERREAARSLVAAVAEFGEGLTDVHDVFRCVRGSLYALDAGEIVRVARGLVNVFKATMPSPDKGEQRDVSGVQPDQPGEV